MDGDVWAAVRARQWWHFLGLPLATLDFGRLDVHAAWRVPAAIVVGGCCLAVAYAINAVCERHTDRSPGKNPLVVRPELAAAVVWLATLLAVIGLVVAWGLGLWALGAACVSLVAGVVYSASAWGKRAPVVGLIGNTLIFAPLLVLMHPGGALAPGVSYEVGLFVVLLAQNQLLHERADVAEDAAAGAWTTGRWLGGRGTRGLVVVLGGVGVGLVGLATSIGAQVVGALCVVAATIVGWVMRPVRARRWHRRCAAIGGGLVFVLQRVL